MNIKPKNTNATANGWENQSVSGAKLDYRSEMMCRNLNGIVDGDGIKRGQFTELGVTILAPIIVGRVGKSPELM